MTPLPVACRRNAYAVVMDSMAGEDREVLMLLRLSVLTGEHANYSQIITIGSSLFTQFMITLLMAFNTNTLNFHQYLKDKLSSHQPFICTTPDTEQNIIVVLIHNTFQSFKNLKMLFENVII